MREVTIAVVVLALGTICGAFLKPSEDQTRPISPDEVAGRPAEPAHHAH